MAKKYNKKAREKLSIFKTDISITPKEELIKKISHKLEKNVQVFITTPNPEILVKASNSKAYRETINSADIAIPDGVGVVMAIKYLYDKKIKRIRGRELFLDLLDIANDNGYKVYLLGATDVVNDAAVEKIKKNYPKIKVKGTSDIQVDVNSQFEILNHRKEYNDVLNQINKFDPHILVVALGAPKQELWISKFRENLDANILAALGGSLDYFVGEQRLPPSIIARLGLEWIWRLIFQPKRFFRILNAVCVFPLLVVKQKYIVDNKDK